MGAVYRAVDTKLNRTVAIKVLSDLFADASARRRFQREARMASSLNHPHILTVHDAGEHEGRQYLITEFVDGGTLNTWARANKRRWREVVELLVGVADGLAVAHQAGILHRDVKPANILVSRSGYAKLADFGLATLTADKRPDADTTQTAYSRPGVILGTIAYMSPEQALGQALDARTDVFSFGVVLYEMLAGRRPFTGDSELEVLKTVIHGTAAPLPPEIPSALRAVVEKALEKNPADRYQSMREMVVDLRRLSREAPVAVSHAPRSSNKRMAAAAMFIVFLGVLAVLLVSSRMTGAQVRSLAVLPFVAADPSQETYADGITEALILNLAQIESLRVISRTSVMRYKKMNMSLPEIARELNVDSIVEGTFRSAADRVAVGARLIRASDEATLWSKAYERPLSDEIQLGREVALEIASSIRAKVSSEVEKRLAGARSINPAAREQYLQGRAHLWRGNVEDRRKSLEFFTQATKLQPDYAEAHASLSLGWHLLRALRAATPAEAYKPARDAALRALDLDPENAEAHISLAGIRWFEEWDWRGADHEYRLARELNPGSMDLCFCYTFFLYSTGHIDEAIEVALRGVASDPFNSNAQHLYGRALYAARRYDDAVAPLSKAIDLNPDNAGARIFLARTYEALGKFEEALKVVDRPEFNPSGSLALAYATFGRRDEAARILGRVVADPSGAGVNQIRDPYETAVAYFAIGDKQSGLRNLSVALDKRQGGVAFAKFDPALDAMQSDPDFLKVVAKLNLPW